MNRTSFNLKKFVKSLNLSPGLLRLVEVESTDNPNVAIAVVAPNLSQEQRAAVADPDMSVGIWVLWLPDHHLLRLSVNIDLGTDSDHEDRGDILVAAANGLNAFEISCAAKVSVRTNEEADKNIGTVSFALRVPSECLEDEGHQKTLSLIVATNMSRLFHEVAHITVGLYQVMGSMGVAPDDTEATQPLN